MKKAVIKNIIFGIISQLFAILYGFCIPILIIKTYGSEVNGLVSSIAQFISYISLLQLGIGPIIKHALFEPIVKKDKKMIGKILGASNQFFRKIAYILVMYIVILIIIFPIIKNSLDPIFIISLIVIISFGTFFEYYLGMTYKLYFTSCQKDYIVDFVNILGYLTSLIIVYFLIKVGNTIQIVKLFGSIIFIIKPFILKYIFEKKSGVIIDNKSNYIFKEKLNGLAHHIAATVQGSTDIIVLTFLSTLTNISIYSVYALVINGIRSIITALVNGLDGYLGMKIANKDKDLNKKFFSYIFYYYSIITTLLSCTIILIIPFIKMYTIEITDANYINSIFASIMVYAEFLYTIRYPYSSLVYSKGHFKETTKYAIIEPIVNIVLSVLLVKKIGLVGIAIGTVCSMPIRSFGFIYHAVNNILNEKMYKHIKIITISFLEFSVLFVLKDHLLLFDKFNYCAFFLQGIFLIFVCGTIIFIINYLLFKNEMQVKSKKNKE